MSKNIDVAIIMGSDSDLPIMKDAAMFLDEMGISYEIKILSVHRTPEKATAYANSLKEYAINFKNSHKDIKFSIYDDESTIFTMVIYCVEKIKEEMK